MRQLMPIQLLALVVATGCPAPVAYTTTTYGTATATGSGPVQVSVDPGSEGQFLYVPATNIPVSSIQSVIVQTADGQQFALDASQVREAAAGRLAVLLPRGVTTGTVTMTTVDGRQLSMPFHVAVSMTGQVIGAVDIPAIPPQCVNVAGTWVGNISDSDPGAVATVFLELLGDCRTLRGFINWQGPRIGSVDSTIDGTWDTGSLTLVARDTQLFNVRPLPGGGFCPTERYQLNMSPDGRTLTGLNITNQPACAGTARVWLQRTQ